MTFCVGSILDDFLFPTLSGLIVLLMYIPSNIYNTTKIIIMKKRYIEVKIHYIKKAWTESLEWDVYDPCRMEYVKYNVNNS